MAQDATVYVVFNFEEQLESIDIRLAALHVSREQPRWSIGEVDARSFRLGRYDRLPVAVTLRRDPSVTDEAQVMASHVHVPLPQIRDQIKLGSARFELNWNLRQDPDPVPETATLLIASAQALARLVDGVVLIEGCRFVSNEADLVDGQAYSALFPKWFSMQ